MIFMLRKEIDVMLLNYSSVLQRASTISISGLGRVAWYQDCGLLWLWGNCTCGDKIMNPGHLQIVLFIFFTNFYCLCGGAGKEFSSIAQKNPLLPRSGRADELLNGSVLLVLGGAPSVLLDRQRESQVNVVVNWRRHKFCQVLDAAELVGCPQGGILLPPYPRWQHVGTIYWNVNKSILPCLI